MDLFSIISFFIAFLIAITIHESAHAWVANKLGDSTAKDLGRISLNPLRHIDLIGSIVLPLIGLFSPSHSFFGWAKPTPYNPHNLKDGHKDEILISIAGPISNLLLAGIFVVFIKLLVFTAHSMHVHSYILANLAMFFYVNVYENIFLAFFNLIPIPPLDGSSFLKMFLPKRFHKELDFMNRFGFLIFLVIFNSPIGDTISLYLNRCVDFSLTLFGLS